MSGTSLDGVDIACVEFSHTSEKISYSFIKTECISYPQEWKEVLQNAHLLASTELLSLDVAYGNYLGQLVNAFTEKNDLNEIDLISSHGHTVFHQPQNGFTGQIGHGAHIQAETGIKVICDFRSQDVALGGQGAPLVPVGDELLFPEYDACVNLGGFANISLKREGKRIAFDICPVNFVLNHYAQRLGKAFDENGEIAKNSEKDKLLLTQLNALDFYRTNHPKSLGREWVEKKIFSLTESSSLPPETIISTFTRHSAEQIAAVINQFELKKILFSGGGSLNRWLMQLIKEQTTAEIFIAEDQLLNFKEALIFAFLGYLKSEGQINVLSSVTGAERDSSSGIIYS